MKTLFVTGGAGFIGSALVRLLLDQTDWQVVNIDKLTYAGNLESLADLVDHPRHVFSRTDICDRPALDALFATHGPAGVIHLAAESHVDRSIHGPGDFIQTNINGTTRCSKQRVPIGQRWRPTPRPRSVSITYRPTRSSARWGKAVCSLSPAPTSPIRRTPHPRRRPTIWCGPGITPTACPP
jgi:NAD(P)-dependent dehydrogenase (short-subunit alcohol dehydrogenase family)